MADFGTDLVRANIVFKLGTEEIAVNTLHFAIWDLPLNDWRTPTHDDLVRIATKLDSEFGTLINQSAFMTDTVLDHVDAYRIDHAYPHHSSDKATHSTAGVHGTGTNALPKEVAIVVGMYGYAPGTYTTQRARKRGRMYLGGFSRNFLDGAGHIPVASAQYFADQLALICTHMNALPLADAFHPVPVIASRTGGQVTKIVATACDTLCDVQRRRQRSESSTVTHGIVT